MNDARREWLDRRVAELIHVETEIENAFTHAPELPTRPEITSPLSTYVGLPIEHRDGLVGYLGTRYVGQHGAVVPVATSVAAGRRSGTEGGGWAVVVPDLYATFAYAAVSYAGLYEAALRLYDEELREIAPRYQDDYAGAMRMLADLLAPTVAEELSIRGLECQCGCPMCSLGVCGCVELGRAAATRTLHTPEDETHAENGFLIQTPRRGSQIAEAGVRAGDRLVAIDRERVGTVREIQAAIRKRRIGETMQLLIVRENDQRQVEATHVHDYTT
jgi:hypothetical protein